MRRDQFEDVVADALDEVPESLWEQVDNLVVVIEDAPTAEQDPTGEGLLGLYEGLSLADRGFDYSAAMPDQITIFYRPHLALGLDDNGLRDEIRTTVLHELAHHLGIDDDRLTELGWD